MNSKPKKSNRCPSEQLGRATPRVQATNSPRNTPRTTYQCVSLIETPVESLDKSTTRDHSVRSYPKLHYQSAEPNQTAVSDVENHKSWKKVLEIQ